ncbi:hypothetical protein Tco_0298981 [Tanacetum coccineum]
MSSTRSHAATQSKGKEISKAPSPPCESKHEVISDEKETQRDKDILKAMDVISKTFKNIYNPQITTEDHQQTPNTKMLIILLELIEKLRIIDRLGFGNENQRVVAVIGNKDTIDEEPTYQELEAHYLYIAKIQEVIPPTGEATGPKSEFINDTYVVEHGDSNTNPDSSDMRNNEGEVNQDEAKFQEGRALLDSLIKNMKLKIDESKRFDKELKNGNTSLATKLERYKDMKRVKDAKFECEKSYGLLEEHKINSEKSLDAYELKVQDF